MRFMVIVKATKDSESGARPDDAMLQAMGKYNEELVKAGVMIAGDGLHPSSQGARVHFDARGAKTVVDGPFAETKELIAGYWIWQVKSKAEALAWLQRCPHPHPGHDTHLELRRLFELDEFEMSDATREQLDELDASVKSPHRTQ